MEPASFEALSLDVPLLRALADEGYERPTQIQRDSIPPALAGRDLLAIAPTGTGKTAAFTLPILQRLARESRPGPRVIRALILTPTRELALQVETSLTAYGRHLALTSAVVMGGVNMNPQIRALRKGVDILVATPGRLLDLMQQGHVKLDSVQVFVLDEADRMLDMGFIHDVRRIAARVPAARQTLFFSATMPPPVAELAHTLLRDPARVEVAPEPVARPRITQRLMFVDQKDKFGLLVSLLHQFAGGRVLVFARTKHRADKIVRQLSRNGIRADAMHGNKSQNARVRTLADFAAGKLRVLVATDIVARGIDVDGISHVINFDLSDEPENHIHRIGRTARAGASGVAISFCDHDEIEKLWQIARLHDEPLPQDTGHAFHRPAITSAYDDFAAVRVGGRRAPAPAATAHRREGGGHRGPGDKPGRPRGFGRRRRRGGHRR
ncbi:MAG: DEAD/DEAH box helicase [Planctomycetes bacterium]|nr:DEAD/DEAH box helicase [Planctomycetota bacterium]MCL4730146.1 DEAD/DEAH box helicase [Planctomycetota bacterium]